MIRIQRLSIATHDKGWGREEWIVNNDLYCGKFLHFKKNSAGSMHFHLKKSETWFLLRGRIKLIQIDTADAEHHVMYLNAGEAVHIPNLSPHQVIAIEDSTIIEFSTPHEETDSYRVEKGDSQRNTFKWSDAREENPPVMGG